MEPINIKDARCRIAQRRRREAQHHAGEWIGNNPVLGGICIRLIEFNPIIGDESADPDVKHQALEAAIASGTVTRSEINLLAAAILRAQELYPDMVLTESRIIQ